MSVSQHTGRRTRPRRDRRSNMVELDIRPIAGALGAEIRGVDLSRLDDATFSAIHRAFLDYLVIFLPGQNLSPVQHHEFAARFGEWMKRRRSSSSARESAVIAIATRHIEIMLLLPQPAYKEPLRYFIRLSDF